MSVFSELSALLKLSLEPDEAEASFAKRLALEANRLPNNVWEGMSKAAQVWVNKALEAHETKQPLPSLEGWGNAVDEQTQSASPPQGGETSSVSQEGQEDMAGKTAAKPKAAKKQNGSAAAAKGRGRPGKYGADATITVIAEENPHRKGVAGYDSFSKYKTGMTIAEALKKGIPQAHVRTHADRGYISVK